MITPSSNPIPDKHADWSIDLQDELQRPYSGDAVQEFIKQLFEQRGGCFYLDSQNSRILIFADSENKDLYLSDSSTYASLLVGTIAIPVPPTTLAELSDDATHRLVTDALISAWNAIVDIVPSAAYNQGNELADKNFVNSSIATNTATYRGNYNLVNDLTLTTAATHSNIETALSLVITTVENNDYCFVEIPTADETPNQIAKIERYKYNSRSESWSYEYTLNNSSFTAAQWSAINSGITSSLVTAFGNKYNKPGTGIPLSDLAQTIQTSLGKADTALQSVKNINSSSLSGSGNIDLPCFLSVNNITNLTAEQLDALRPGDIVIKNTGTEKHTYHVSYKDATVGELSLTYVDHQNAEEVYYEKQSDVWTYITTDITPLNQGGSSDTDMSVETFSGATLNVAAGKLYRANVAISALTITLPAVNDTTKTKNIIINLTTDSTANITFTSADSKTIKYYSTYDIQPSTEYEINIMFNGSYWVIASAEIVQSV